MSQTCKCILLDYPWHLRTLLSYHSLTTWPCIYLTPLKNSSRPPGSCSRISTQPMNFQLHIPWPVVFINMFFISNAKRPDTNYIHLALFHVLHTFFRWYKIDYKLCKHLSTSQIISFCNTYTSFLVVVVFVICLRMIITIIVINIFPSLSFFS